MPRNGPRIARRVAGLLAATHPGPAAAVTAVTLMLAVAAGYDAARVAIVTAVLALDQVSVGLSNDARDAARDHAVGRRDKPIVRGEVRVRTVWICAGVSAAGSVALSITLGPLAAALHAVALGSAWAYNLALKSTVFSVVPYLVSFGLLPSIVTAAGPDPVLASIPLSTAAVLLGAAAHMANVLPDLEDDAATGVRGLPHRLPRRIAALAVWPLLLAAAIALAVEIGISEPIGISAVVLSGALAIVGAVLAHRRAGTRILFRIVMAAAVLDVALLVIGVFRG